MTTQNRIVDIKHHLVDQFDLSEQQLDELLPVFIDTIHKNVNDLVGIAENNNTTMIMKMGHTIKGALLNLGLDDLAELAKSVEKFPFEKKDAAECYQLITTLKERIDEIQLH